MLIGELKGFFGYIYPEITWRGFINQHVEVARQKSRIRIKRGFPQRFGVGITAQAAKTEALKTSK